MPLVLAQIIDCAFQQKTLSLLTGRYLAQENLLPKVFKVHILTAGKTSSEIFPMSLQRSQLASYGMKGYRAVNELAVSLHYKGGSLQRLKKCSLPCADWNLMPCSSWTGRMFRVENVVMLQ